MPAIWEEKKFFKTAKIGYFHIKSHSPTNEALNEKSHSPTNETLNEKSHSPTNETLNEKFTIDELKCTIKGLIKEKPLAQTGLQTNS